MTWPATRSVRRVLLTGAAGQLGAHLRQELVSAGHDVTAFTRAELDIGDASRVVWAARAVRPHVIINCAAYNDVDAAERDGGAAFQVNRDGPENLARAALAVGAALVHFSTDFVFDGTATEPYTEGAPTNPLNVYGRSKLAGEHAARRVPEHYVLRLESLFGGLHPKRSTVDRLLDTLSAGGMVRAFSDRYVSPSYVPDVATATRLLIEHGAAAGTYHCVASGQTTWYELACTAAGRLLSGRVIAVSASEVRLPAARPQYCALANDKLAGAGIVMPTWQSALLRHQAARLGIVPGEVRAWPSIASI